MSNRVVLQFDKTLTNLAGYEYGLSIYYGQVQNKVDVDSVYEIVFPDQICGVASSFVQGLFENIVEQIGLLKTEENTRIISSREGFSEMVLSKLQ